MGIAVRVGFAGAALWVLAACGGGGGGGGSVVNPGNPGGGGTGYTPGVFPPRADFANQCITPRSGTSDRAGSAFTEKMFLRSWTNEFYLWFAEVPELDPTTTSAVVPYFNNLKTPQTTPSGAFKDRFHFTFDTAEWIALSQGGQSFGYGMELVLVSPSPPRRAYIPFVEPGTPASAAGVARGMEIVRINNVDFVNDNTQAGVDVLNNAFNPSAAGQTFTFVLRPTSGSDVTVQLTSASITHKPVLLDTTFTQGADTVGYLVFNDHIATAEAELVAAINRMQTAGVDDLILDIRYNGGGFLDIASELTYMISGRTGTFESLVFNSKNPNRNPVLNQPLVPTPIHTTTQDFSLPPGQTLPTLNLPRLYVITGPNTCSASESIINGLRGVNVPVFLIGSTTCGKPFGFYPEDNCGTTYFSIQFQGLNAMSFGDYPDGFAAQNQTGRTSVKLAGCSIADDLTHALGNPLEGRLKAALDFRASGNSIASCPAASGFAPGAQLKAGQQAMTATDGQMIKSPLRENRILRDR